ncbi:MAG TPA: helix-turn-helix transcriptional regulator [Thermoanaerobaculia bacterium]|nr:helix-turn-helix transcriptional regulator [Thermoanaerobaculia bacterium]
MIEPFATRLTRLREERQLSQKQLAARIGCPPRWISRYERGPQVPRTPEIYLRLSVALSVSLAELLGAPPTPGSPADPRLAPAQMPALLAILDAALALADADLPPEDRQAAYDALRKRLEQL